MFQIVGAMAEFERTLVQERGKDGVLRNASAFFQLRFCTRGNLTDGTGSNLKRGWPTEKKTAHERPLCTARTSF